jgi:hypothetical protein
MRMSLFARPLTVAHGMALLAVAAVLCGGAIAVSAIPGPDGALVVCAKTVGKAKGALRAIDHDQRCARGERRLSLNQEGRPGAAGDPGAAGSAGAQGAPGADGAVGAQGIQGPAGSAATAPAGAVVFFNLAACPSGWSELVAARGRYMVGVPAGGTLAGTGGTALADQENRSVGQHSHGVTDPGHHHGLQPGTAGVTSGFDSFVLTNTSSLSAAPIGFTAITINDAGSVPGTNAPYLQLLVCQKQ